MPGLILKLSPFERVMINGAVIENGDRRTKLKVLSPNSQILRLRDAIHPNAVTTPVARACYLAQLLLIGEINEDEGLPALKSSIVELKNALKDADSDKRLTSAIGAISQKDFYKGLRLLKSLLSREDRLLHYKEVKYEL